MSLLSKENNPEDLFSFAGSVGRFGDNNRDDVIKAQALLANAGYYELPEPGMPTGWPGGELNRALIRFQKDHGLEPDGTLLPVPPHGVSAAGEGETVEALQNKLGKRLWGFAAPSVEEADDFYRTRPMLGGNGEPPTNVRLRGDNGAGENIGLKPTHTMTDESPEQIELKPGQQQAFLAPAVQIGARVIPQIPNLLRGLGLLAPAATLPLSGDSQKPADIPDNDATRPPEPAQPEEDRQQQDFAKPQRGRIIIAEDGKELHVPPLGTWAKDLNREDRQIVQTLNDAVAVELDKLHTGGSRGNRQTQEGVNMALQECLPILRSILPEAVITHEFGGNTEGDAGQEPKKEEHLWQYNEAGKRVRRGSNRTDFSILIARDIAEMLRGNTYDGKGGEAVERESNAANSTRKKTPDEELVMIEKQRPGRSEEQLRRDARDVCLAAAERIRAKWDKQGEFAKPALEKPAEYPGPQNARRAKERRELREKQ